MDIEDCLDYCSSIINVDEATKELEQLRNALNEAMPLLEKLAYWGNRYKPTPTRADSIEAIHWLAQYQSLAAAQHGVQPTDDAAKIVDENQVVIGG